MKLVKLYDDVHRDVKIEAAKSGRTATYIASTLIRMGLKKAAKGEIDLRAPEESEPASNRKPNRR